VLDAPSARAASGLPAALPTDRGSLDAPNPPAPELKKPTLLICDDEDGPRQSLRIVFKNDYRVVVASNGPDAIALARVEGIDVAVLDISMEGMTGVELLHELKVLDPAIEVVMLTAYETLETARQALRSGASDYLNKPFDIPTIRAAVAKALEKRRSALRVSETGDQLASLQRQLTEHTEREEVARHKGEIYASVLHDINSPLTVISGFVELINRSVENAASVEGAQLESIKGDLNRMNSQVGRCFEISRRYLSFLNTNKVENTYIGVTQMLSDLKELLLRHPAARNHRLTIHEFPEDAVAQINGTDLLQILLNLTINALQAGETPHRVEVQARRVHDPRVLEQYGDTSQERFISGEGFDTNVPLLAVSVLDTGAGIPPAALEKMFREKFTTKAPDQGTGLGLSIVRRLAVEAQAAVHVKTKLGSGSTFTLFVRLRS